jgi:hypothetical protein
VDEIAAQFFVAVGRLCTDASVARLTVRVRLASGIVIEGVPQPPPDTEGERQFAETGYADELRVAGVALALSEVVEATLHHPVARTPGLP